MTTLNETVNEPVKQKPAKHPAAGKAAGGVSTLGLCAIVSWLAGVASHRGFGVPVPFLAGFFLVLAFAFFVRLTVLVIAGAWFNVAIEATPRLVTTEVVAEAVAQMEVGKVTDAMAFLSMDKRIRGE